jgi:organic radical activating enzyme
MGRKHWEGETLHQYKERMIDSVSESYCAAKWYNATIWLGHGQTASCHHPPGHWIPLEELENNPTAIHNTKHKKLMRKYMQEGKRPSECEYCWKVEDMGKDHISDRVFKTEIFKDEDVEASATMPWDEDVMLRTLEISFDRACNLKCSYCNPAFSTAWVKDINQYGAYQNIQSDGRGHFVDTAPWAEPAAKKSEDNPYIQAFHQWWENGLADNLEEIRITGGEPIMHTGTWKLFEWFEQNPTRGRNMRFAINSNLSPETPKVLDKLIEKSWHVPNFEIYTSMEATKDQAEYIRDGLDYDLWKSNIHRVLKESNVAKLHMMMTINSLCLTTITEFMDEMLDLREDYGRRAPTMTLNILRFPSFQSAAILPPEIKTHYKEKLETWYLSERPQSMLTDGERASIQRLIDYLDIVKTPHKNTADQDKLYNDFKAFFSQFDVRREKNFVETFAGPIAEWYQTLEAEVPTAEQIKTKTFVLEVGDRAGDPATTEAYDGGDDEHERAVGGWDTENDALGGVIVGEETQ